MTCRTRPTPTLARAHHAVLLAALLLLAATPALAAPATSPAGDGAAIGRASFSLTALADAVRAAFGDALASLWQPSGGAMDPDGTTRTTSGGAMDPDGGPGTTSGGAMDPDGSPHGG